jgi:hypothetical protein
MHFWCARPAAVLLTRGPGFPSEPPRRHRRLERGLEAAFSLATSVPMPSVWRDTGGDCHSSYAPSDLALSQQTVYNEETFETVISW